MGTLKIRGIGPIAIMSRIIYNIRDMKGGGIVDNGYTKRIRERVLSLEDGTVFVICGGRSGSSGNRIGTKLSLDDCPMWEYSIEPVRTFNTGNSSMVLYQRWSI